MITAVIELGKLVLENISSWIKGKQAINEAIVQNKVRLAQSEQSHNQEWEMKQLDNSGWKDDVLFYSIIMMYVYSAFDPLGARAVFESWKVLPEWWLQITGWLVASVLGVRKLGDTLPALISGVKGALNTTQTVAAVVKEIAPAKEQGLIGRTVEAVKDFVSGGVNSPPEEEKAEQ